jgi:hypothetical protein
VKTHGLRVSNAWLLCRHELRRLSPPTQGDACGTAQGRAVDRAQ